MNQRSNNNRDTLRREGTHRSRRSSYDEVPAQRRVAERGFNPEGASRVVIGIVLFLLCFVVGRLVYLQVFRADWLADKARERTNVIPIAARRGTIYDRNGNVLAMSVDCKTVYANPKEVQDVQTTADVLARVLGGTSRDYHDALSQDTTFVYLSKLVDNSVAEELQEQLSANGCTGVHFLPDVKRVYPYGEVGAQVIGMINAEGHGLTGLEYYYDEMLSGSDGSRLMEAGADGTPIAGGAYEETPAKDGTGIVISLDVDVQRAAETAVARGVRAGRADAGSAVVTDPDNGEILAICSTPFFNPNDLANATNESLSLKPVVHSYELGSVYKVLTVAIGIEQGIVHAGTTYYVPGSVMVGDDEVHDDDMRKESMYMDVREIMRRSSNTGAVMVGEAIGEQCLYDGFASFGIGTITGVDYPGEAGGLVPQLEDWTGATLGATSFGQGFAVPPIQLVSAVGAVANGGTLLTPHLLVAREDHQSISWPERGKPISQATCDELNDILRTVAEEGTATAARVPGYELVGKTGTGEVADEEHGGYRDDVYNSSYIGYLPVGEQRVLAYLGLYGTEYLASYCACPAWAEMMEEALHKLGIPPTLEVTAKDYELNDYSYYYKTFDFDAPQDDKKKDKEQAEAQNGEDAQDSQGSAGDAHDAYSAYDDYEEEY